ncbi:TPA: hypothetical protein DEP94_02280 [Candidatus Nomurabacteria bacterium]|nr:hypothetical protein [Candidatus Nomurabacteria bacterium]
MENLEEGDLNDLFSEEHLSIIFKAAKEKRLPSPVELRNFLLKPTEKFPIWATVRLGENPYNQYDRTEMFIRDFSNEFGCQITGWTEEGGGELLKHIKTNLRLSTEEHPVDLVSVTPIQLGFDPLLCVMSRGLKIEDQFFYLCKLAEARGLKPCDAETILHLCLQKNEPFRAVLATKPEVNNGPPQPYFEKFVLATKKPGLCKLEYCDGTLDTSGRYIFSRPRQPSSRSE